MTQDIKNFRYSCIVASPLLQSCVTSSMFTRNNSATLIAQRNIAQRSISRCESGNIHLSSNNVKMGMEIFLGLLSESHLTRVYRIFFHMYEFG